MTFCYLRHVARGVVREGVVGHVAHSAGGVRCAAGKKSNS